MKLNKIRHYIAFYLILPISDVIMHTTIMKWYRQIKIMYFWDKPKVMAWQSERLNKLVRHFYENTIYYKRLLDTLGIDPETVVNINDLKKLPPLTKKTIREHYDELVPNNIHTIYSKQAATGGSTGVPLKYLLDLSSWSYTTASNIYSFELQGLHYGDRYVALGSSSLYPVNKKSTLHKIYYKLRNKMPLNGINMSNEIMKGYVDFIKKHNINYIYGYASSIYLLATYVVENHIELKLNAALPTSEILTDEYRELIIKAFSCKVMDGYGARDGGITADEITPGHYHVGYNTICELADCHRMDTGKLLVTDLLNYAFPFIRYDIGDEVTLPSENYDFYNGQVITKVFGRESHILRLENGHTLTGPGFTILFKDLNVISYRILKTGPLHIKVEILPNQNFTKEENQIIYDTIKKHAGEECNVDIVKVDYFKEETSGKRSYFIN